jgi:hypothetical protein
VHPQSLRCLIDDIDQVSHRLRAARSLTRVYLRNGSLLVSSAMLGPISSITRMMNNPSRRAQNLHVGLFVDWRRSEHSHLPPMAFLCGMQYCAHCGCKGDVLIRENWCYTLLNMLDIVSPPTQAKNHVHAQPQFSPGT